MDVLKSLLPANDGLLPYWLLFTSVASFFNTYQSYTTLFFARRLFAGPLPTPEQKLKDSERPKLGLPSTHPLSAQWLLPPSQTGPTITTNSPVTPLSARTFGGWNALSAVIRFYAAYHIHNPEIFQLVMWTYTLSTVFILGEVFVFDTARIKSGCASMLGVGIPSFAWCAWGWWNGWYGNGL